MARVVHFEIQADDPARAVAFYQRVFGWGIERWGEQDYWLVRTGEKAEAGVDGGILPRRGPRPTSGAPVNAFVCTIDVPDIDGFEAKVGTAGGITVLPKMAVPTIGWLVYCQDTEGNIFGMMQADPGAK